MRKSQSAKTLTDICPKPLAPLAELASNLWWSWSPQAAALLASIDTDLWARTEHNPVAMLRALPARRMRALSGDAAFLSRLAGVHREFDRYRRAKTWFQERYGRRFHGKIAYLCMEYGLHESLPIYAGGLGVLAGDHVKAAGDLGVPLVGVGVLWRNGYVRQHIGRSGTQEDWFVDLSARDLPLREVTSPSGRPLRLRIPLVRQTLVARAWRLDVGRVPLYLLDSDLPDNPSRLRRLSYRLYCNGREDRLCQETLLGVGGLRLLQALHIPISVLHLNEGHAVFASIDRLTQSVAAGQPLRQALRDVADTSVFTIHTPVPAGNETFDP
ncbi:MAG: alpha-glucan family phosphorylase, partial [Phycisphaerae bacterium]|nr:alpha-glucan family phosphorylase [Phycisphaerae bacterium]